jgi:hypothetical protein
MNRTDTALRIEAMNILIRQLGEVDAERFVTIVKSDEFNYTEWQKNLCRDKSIEELHQMATAFESENP